MKLMIQSLPDEVTATVLHLLPATESCVSSLYWPEQSLKLKLIFLPFLNAGQHSKRKFKKKKSLPTAKNPQNTDWIAVLSCHMHYLLCRSNVFLKKLNIPRTFGEHSACHCLEKIFHNLTEKKKGMYEI